MNILQKLLFPLCVLAVFGLSYSLGYQGESLDSKIEVEVAPSDTKILIDDSKARMGINHVVTGTHSIVVKRSGFKDESRRITTESGQTVYVGFVLEPNAEETRNWYQINPKDDKIAEGISSHQVDYDSQRAVSENSLLQLLPVEYGDGHGGIVTIDSGVPLAGSNEPAIYITASSATDRQNALVWLRKRGYNPSTMDIVFSNELSSYIALEGE